MVQGHQGEMDIWGGEMFCFPPAFQAAWLQGRASSCPPNTPEINTFLMGEKSRDGGGACGGWSLAEMADQSRRTGTVPGQCLDSDAALFSISGPGVSHATRYQEDR